MAVQQFTLQRYPSVVDITLQPVKGTRDFYPDEMRLRTWLFGIWRDTARQFGFEEYDACVVESEELYIRKAGDEITEQLYTFPDKSGRRLALRPEMTPSLARLILQRKNALTFPLKWFAIPQCFRYERMTRGRKREHFQWNADIVGQADSVAEVEVISVLITALQRMGLTEADVRLHINDRRLLNAALNFLGVPKDIHLPIMVVIDKRDKVSKEALGQMLLEQGMTGDQIEKLDRILSQQHLDDVMKIIGHTAEIDDLVQLIQRLQKVGMWRFCQFDISVVRGLSYYTGTVFELRDAGASLRAICGGGRYDSLLSSYGGATVPAIGFGFGDVVILELLSDLGKLPKLTSSVDYYVIPYSREQHEQALEIGQKLRAHEGRFRCDVDFGGRKLKRALERADEVGARKAVLLMPDELARGEVVLRDMAARQETRVKLAEFLASPT